MLITNNIHSQQFLNNRKELLREEQHPFIAFSFVEWFVEKMLSSYNTVYKYVAPIIHQINVFTFIIKSVEYYIYEYPRSETNQNRRLSAKSGLHARKATGKQPVVQIPIPAGNGSLVQGEHRP